jgi:hypothetical protein
MFVSSSSESASQPEYNKMKPALYESKELALAGNTKKGVGLEPTLSPFGESTMFVSSLCQSTGQHNTKYVRDAQVE